MSQKMRIASFTLAVIALSAVSATAQLTIQLKDYAEMPNTGAVIDGKGGTDPAWTFPGILSRVNGLFEEPGGATRFFLIDQNGPVFILDKATKKITTYLDFNGRDKMPGLFHKFTFMRGAGAGVNGFAFDPDYKRNGKFYTVHTEDSSVNQSAVPDNRTFPGLNVEGYVPTAPMGAPGPAALEGVIVEWTDTNTSNTTFEGTAREITRLQLLGTSHTLGPLQFNPTAKAGDPEWRVMYIGCGESGSGGGRPPFRSNPQRLDTHLGKILRIIPDPKEHVSSSALSGNGRYRIPNDNPFVKTEGARGEIWAYGFRNPHRLSWAVDDNPANNRLIADTIGQSTWEMIQIIHKGANYGYSAREGNQVMNNDRESSTGPLPDVDKIPLYIHDTPTDTMVVPTYPVAVYGHVPSGGDAIGSGYLYHGKLVPALRGKYLFTDLTTGHIWYLDYKDMLAADDGNPKTMATLHEVKIAWDNPNDSPDAGEQTYDSMYPIVQMVYQARGGKVPAFGGVAKVSGKGRADVRFSIDDAGELYMYTKSDGMIRTVVGAK